MRLGWLILRSRLEADIGKTIFCARINAERNFTHYWQSLNKKSFDENKGKDVFYIFVLKHGTEINYLIVPSLWIDENSEKFDLVKGERWQLYFSPIRDGKVMEVRKSGLDMTLFLNNWGILRQTF